MTKHLNTMDVVRALRQTLATSGAEYPVALRSMRVGEGPIFIVGDGPAYWAAQTAALGLEHLAGRPCVVQSSAEFNAYGLPMVTPRVPVLWISLADEPESAVEALRTAKHRGAWLMVLAHNSRHPLIGAADQSFIVPIEDAGPSASCGSVCAHAAAAALGLHTGRIFKPPSDRQRVEFEEWQNLPEELAQVFSVSSNAVRQMIEAIRPLRLILILGYGFSRPVASQAAAWMMAATPCQVQGGSPAEFAAPIFDSAHGETGMVFLSGSQSPHRKLMRHFAEEAVHRKCSTFAITDGGDSELIQHTRISLLLPALHEMAAALLQLATLQWMASEVGRETPQATSANRLP